METWDRVLLYGSFDGFAYSTDDLPRINVVLDGGERVEVPGEFVVSADQMVNKNKIKLKDVIARIKGFDLGTQKEWINEILNELCSDYGTLKYKDGYEQGKFDSAVERAETIIPQIVADWIKHCKTNGIALGYALYDPGRLSGKKVYDWIVESLENQELFARAWIDGYTVEKEKRYFVRVKGVYFNNCLIFEKRNKTWFFSSIYEIDHQRGHHTRKELEEAGFGWVFDCPEMEVKEVEG
jgi:phage protein